jgi:hypothetical protein
MDRVSQTAGTGDPRVHTPTGRGAFRDPRCALLSPRGPSVLLARGERVEREKGGEPAEGKHGDRGRQARGKGRGRRRRRGHQGEGARERTGTPASHHKRRGVTLVLDTGGEGETAELAGDRFRRRPSPNRRYRRLAHTPQRWRYPSLNEGALLKSRSVQAVGLRDQL